MKSENTVGVDETKSITETHIKRQAARHDCLPTVHSLLGDGDKLIEIVYGEEKYILYCADQSSQGKTKISCTGTMSPTNQLMKDTIHVYSLSLHLPQI